jgi:hypothetical protein
MKSRPVFAVSRVLAASLLTLALTAAGCGGDGDEAGGDSVANGSQAAAVPTADQVVQAAREVPGYKGCGKIDQALNDNQPANSLEPSERIAITCDGATLVFYDSYPDEAAREHSEESAFSDFNGLLAGNVRIWYPNIEAPGLPKGVKAGPDNALDLFERIKSSCGCGEIRTR